MKCGALDAMRFSISFSCRWRRCWRSRFASSFSLFPCGFSSVNFRSILGIAWSPNVVIFHMMLFGWRCRKPVSVRLLV